MFRFQSSSILTSALLPALALCTLPLGAQDRTADAVLVDHPATARASLPLELSETLAVPAMSVLARAEIAAPEDVEAIGRWNADGRRPTKVGFSRLLGTSHLVSISPDLPAFGSDAVFETTSSSHTWASRPPTSTPSEWCSTRSAAVSGHQRPAVGPRP